MLVPLHSILSGQFSILHKVCLVAGFLLLTFGIMAIWVEINEDTSVDQSQSKPTQLKTVDSGRAEPKKVTSPIILKRFRKRTKLSDILGVDALIDVTNKDELHIEEIRDSLPRLIPCWQSLYQWGNIKDAMSLLLDLSENDRIRLLCLGMVAGTEDIKNVSQKFLSALNPEWKNAEIAMKSLTLDERTEIDICRKQIKGEALPGEPRSLAVMTHEDRARIKAELRVAVSEMRMLTVEDASWVLIPEKFESPPIWVDAVGGQEVEGLAGFRWPYATFFTPDKKEQYQFLTVFRRFQWVLHIHNHPSDFEMGAEEVSEPSDADTSFAAYWKGLRSELESKFKFFIVSDDIVNEYSLPGNQTEKWTL